MKNNELIPRPEREPDIPLFSLFELYRRQPHEVLDAHAAKLGNQLLASVAIIELCDTELLDRSVGAEDLSEEFAEFKADVEDKPDKWLKEEIDINRDRILTLIGHYELATEHYTPSHSEYDHLFLF